VDAFRKQKPASFVSFGRRPAPIPVAADTKAKPKAAEAEEDKP
jgi:hypothetical protein